MTTSLLTTAAPGSWAADAISGASERLLDIGLIVLIALVVIWALTTSIVVARDHWRNRKRAGSSRPGAPSQRIGRRKPA